MPLKGAKAHINRLKKLSGPDMTRLVGKALFAGGEMIRTEARVSISRGSASGHSGGKHQHVPSRPGEPPNFDTGWLAGSIEVVQPDPILVEVGALAHYAAPLEFGTSKMAARPFMRPARDAKRKEVQALVQKAMNRAVKGSRSPDQ